MRRTLLCITSALVLTASAAAQASACSDIALVLAVDGSDSIDDAEYGFQKAAISAAFRDKAVISTLREAGVVAVSAVFWGDARAGTQALGWFVIDDGDDAEGFAREIDNNQRAVFGNTDIGNGIWSALTMLSDPNACARKLIVDISGDGRETLGPKRPRVISLYQARRRAEQMDARINALVVSDDLGDLASYYARKVILGADAFVMHVKNYGDYSAALKKKLIRELASDDAVDSRFHASAE
ncbi:DUF1194 domain-containing protein [Rhizobium sp. P32RR-XVIII]|uniref:DUF1194 domain-containing protein n=1 Tax=Rhizobium sp. P32RR-XVIII TaxID=2726738 RepID=UPI0014577015|nr:DUF1194 domain-containing protein [Rhizobium sp. P32RR-XVIII]NLS05029.1 DUF1194 domain-containing protein [Rhizobium sp. P32RR-XVIII]